LAPDQLQPGGRGAPPCPHTIRYTLTCVRADWAAFTGPIGKLAVLVHRFGHLLDSGHLPSPVSQALWPVYRLLDTVWVKLLVGADLHHTCCIGPGLQLAHAGRGVVLGPNVVIGSEVALFHQVTLGTTETRPHVWPLPVPVIGDQARIGTGARVLGPVRVGPRAVVGANAVVLADVPEGASVPAAHRWK
jgi:serine O-acetyltransferase